MTGHEPVSWRKPVILALCALVLAFLLAGRAFFGDPPPGETTTLTGDS